MRVVGAFSERRTEHPSSLAIEKKTRYSPLHIYECYRRRPLRPHEVRAGNRLLIKSTCIHCGMSMLLSANDGSLQKWERWHVCDSVIAVQ
jgi:hypothetical protein